MNHQETGKRVKLKCQGIDPEPYECSVIHPEKPGEFCFPPLASLITGAARLMLALLEHCVTELGGTYAMEDTDSMAIVATNRGGFIFCPGGNLVKNGVEGVNALTWKQVDEIVKKCEALNPYNRKIISGSVLKIEDDNTCLKWVEIDGPSFCTACTETVHSTRGRLGGRSRLFPIPRQGNDRGNNAILIGYQQATQGIRDKMMMVHSPRRSKSGIPLFSCSMMVSECSNFLAIRKTSGKHLDKSRGAAL
jgi:hypothetical protein